MSLGAEVFPDGLFRLVHLFPERAGRHPQGAVAQNDQLFQGVGCGHPHPVPFLQAPGGFLDIHVGGLRPVSYTHLIVSGLTSGAVKG